MSDASAIVEYDRRNSEVSSALIVKQDTNSIEKKTGPCLRHRRILDNLIFDLS